MLKVEDWMDIHALRRAGHSIKAITRLTGFSRNTVRRQLRQASPSTFQTPGRASQLDAYKPYLEKRVAECSLSAVRLYAQDPSVLAFDASFYALDSAYEDGVRVVREKPVAEEATA